MKRKPISKSLRFKIFERDGFMCQYCGRDPINFDVVLEVDHSISVKDGGNNDIDNLITSCFDCNRGKGRHSTIIGNITDIEKEQEKLSKAKERLLQVKKIQSIRKNKSRILKEIEIEKFSFIYDKLENEYSDSLINEVVKGIKSQFNKGINIDLLEDCLDITINRFEYEDEVYVKNFIMYFYGVLRRKNG